MCVQDNKPNGFVLPADRLARRLRWAIIVSVILNIFGWRAVAAMAKRPMFVPPRSVEISRVILDNRGRKIEKKVLKEQIKRKISQLKTPSVQSVRQASYHQPQRPPEPPQHNKVLTAAGKGPANEEPVVAEGGSAQVGKAIVQQPAASEAIKPAPEVKPEPAPVIPKAPEPIKAKPDPAPAPAIPKAPVPEPVIKQPDPAPVKKGPTRDSEPAEEIKPEIPDELKHGDFKSFVRVKVEIDEEGKPTPILRTSSGNAEIDKRVLNALRKWRWKPALENGTPIASVQLFKFEFLVE